MFPFSPILVVPWYSSYYCKIIFPSYNIKITTTNIFNNNWSIHSIILWYHREEAIQKKLNYLSLGQPSFAMMINTRNLVEALVKSTKIIKQWFSEIWCQSDPNNSPFKRIIRYKPLYLAVAFSVIWWNFRKTARQNVSPTLPSVDWPVTSRVNN